MVGAGAPAFHFYGAVLSNPWHTVGIHLHSVASANAGWTRGSGQERQEMGKREGAGGSEEKVLHRDFGFFSVQAAEVFRSNFIFFNSSSKAAQACSW